MPSMWRGLLLLLFLPSACGGKALLKAIDDNNAAMINIALKSGEKVNEPGPDDGETPLVRAVRAGKYKAVKALLKGKADTSIPGTDGMPVMHIAAAAGHSRVVQILHTHGLDPNVMHGGLVPLHRAVLGGHLDATKALLNADVPPDHPTAEGEVPLDLAKDIAVRGWLTKELSARRVQLTKEEV